MPLRPARVHAQEHLGPITGLGAARSRLDADIGVARIVRPAQHRLQFEVGKSLFDGSELLLQLVLEPGILLGQFSECPQIANGRSKLVEGLQNGVQRL